MSETPQNPVQTPTRMRVKNSPTSTITPNSSSKQQPYSYGSHLTPPLTPCDGGPSPIGHCNPSTMTGTFSQMSPSAQQQRHTPAPPPQFNVAKVAGTKRAAESPAPSNRSAKAATRPPPIKTGVYMPPSVNGMTPQLDQNFINSVANAEMMVQMQAMGLLPMGMQSPVHGNTQLSPSLQAVTYKEATAQNILQQQQQAPVPQALLGVYSPMHSILSPSPFGQLSTSKTTTAQNAQKQQPSQVAGSSPGVHQRRTGGMLHTPITHPKIVTFVQPSPSQQPVQPAAQHAASSAYQAQPTVQAATSFAKPVAPITSKDIYLGLETISKGNTSINKRFSSIGRRPNPAVGESSLGKLQWNFQRPILQDCLDPEVFKRFVATHSTAYIEYANQIDAAQTSSDIEWAAEAQQYASDLLKNLGLTKTPLPPDPNLSVGFDGKEITVVGTQPSAASLAEDALYDEVQWQKNLAEYWRPSPYNPWRGVYPAQRRVHTKQQVNTSANRTAGFPPRVVRNPHYDGIESVDASMERTYGHFEIPGLDPVGAVPFTADIDVATGARGRNAVRGRIHPAYQSSVDDGTPIVQLVGMSRLMADQERHKRAQNTSGPSAAPTSIFDEDEEERLFGPISSLWDIVKEEPEVEIQALADAQHHEFAQEAA
jgi:hypothetical protein